MCVCVCVWAGVGGCEHVCLCVCATMRICLCVHTCHQTCMPSCKHTYVCMRCGLRPLPCLTFIYLDHVKIMVFIKYVSFFFTFIHEYELTAYVIIYSLTWLMLCELNLDTSLFSIFPLGHALMTVMSHSDHMMLKHVTSGSVCFITANYLTYTHLSY